MSKALNSLFNLSAENVEKVIKKPIVDVIITSTPYADLKNYGVSGQIGFGQDYKTEYIPSLQNIFHQCFNVTKHTGSLWVVVDTFKKHGEVQLLPFDLAVI
jgi:DNA modification methylase